MAERRGDIYKVVVNHEEQYSIWPERARVPEGWKEVGQRGSPADCAAYIEELGTDRR